MSFSKQPQRILEYLRKHGRINPLQAWTVCGVYRLSAAILILRKDGYVIETTRMDVTNKFGEQCHVGNYIMHGRIGDIMISPDAAKHITEAQLRGTA